MKNKLFTILKNTNLSKQVKDKISKFMDVIESHISDVELENIELSRLKQRLDALNTLYLWETGSNPGLIKTETIEFMVANPGQFEKFNPIQTQLELENVEMYCNLLNIECKYETADDIRNLRKQINKAYAGLRK